MRSQITISLGQLSELEFVNCQLREQVKEYQERVQEMQRSLEKESVICKNLMAENNKLQNWQKEVSLVLHFIFIIPFDCKPQQNN